MSVNNVIKELIMNDDYMAYPLTVKALAGEIIKACNDYMARHIDNNRLREIIFWYAIKQPDKLFAAENLNPTVSKIIGKRRVKLINNLLDGYQDHLLRGKV